MGGIFLSRLAAAIDAGGIINAGNFGKKGGGWISAAAYW